MSQHEPRGLSRRAILAGLGAGAVALGTGGSDIAAAAPPVTGSQDGDLARPEPNAAAPVRSTAVTPRTRMLNTLDWRPINGGAFTYESPGGLRPTVSDIYNCAIDLEPGSTIVSIEVYLNPGGTSRLVNLSRYDGASPTVFSVKAAASTAGNAVETVTVSGIDHVVLGPPWAYRVVGLSLSPTAALFGGVVTYLPPEVAPVVQATQPEFFPITPVRVYDSRWTPAPGGVTVGVLASGGSRVVSVADGRAVAGGAVTTANVVPAGATAVTYNLTAVPASAAGGFLAITPSDAAAYAASAVNWSGAGAIANGGVVPLDASRQVRIWAGGGGAADVILDITGYYR